VDAPARTVTSLASWPRASKRSTTVTLLALSPRATRRPPLARDQRTAGIEREAVALAAGARNTVARRRRSSGDGVADVAHSQSAVAARHCGPSVKR
jgi:hypothetical protein